MKEVALLFVVVLLAYVQSATTSSETIWVKEVTTRFQTDKRTPSDVDLPDHLTFRFSRGSDALTLNLERNHDINPNTDTYFVQKVKNGRLQIVKSRNFEKENVAYYQDRENGASMTVRCVKRSVKPCDRVINGNIRMGDRRYELRPAEGSVTSRNLFEVQGVLDKPYVLQDKSNIRSEKSVEYKDVASVDVKNVEEERKDLLQRLHGQIITQSSRNIDDTGATSVKTRFLKKRYYVNVAVLVDSSIWDIYASTIRSTNILKKKDKVKRKIREAYSHIMNSVNLLYKGIEDNSITITVTLSAFIFFQHAALFPHSASIVEMINGTTRIAAYPYHADLFNWDLQYGVNIQIPFNHAMLFTRHDLYRDSFADDDLFGLSYLYGICIPGKRTSLIQTDDYDITVNTAAHELGHNLGAYHDGDDDAKDCNPLDLFIMTPDYVRNHPSMNYTKNPYLFSKCSEKSFKKTLKYKDCVNKKGKVYNETEWKEHVSKTPGEVYSPNEQCHLINGPNSVYCGTVPADICHLMRCTDPTNRKCGPRYYKAATGTECGNNRWCIEGRCVSKSSK